MMTIDQMLEVVQAAKDGKCIEFKARFGGVNWFELTAQRFNFNFVGYDYRVRREPYVVFINIYADGSFGQAYLDSEKAAAVGGHLGTVVKFIEVID